MFFMCDNYYDYTLYINKLYYKFKKISINKIVNIGWTNWKKKKEKN